MPISKFPLWWFWCVWVCLAVTVHISLLQLNPPYSKAPFFPLFAFSTYWNQCYTFITINTKNYSKDQLGNLSWSLFIWTFSKRECDTMINKNSSFCEHVYKQKICCHKLSTFDKQLVAACLMNHLRKMKNRKTHTVQFFPLHRGLTLLNVFFNADTRTFNISISQYFYVFP